MKPIFIALLGVLIVMLFISLDAKAQSYKRSGNTFEQVSTKNTSNTATKTIYTWADSKGKKYPIFITKNGRCFVNKVSSKTGKEYKYYLEEKISKEICDELGVIYEPKKKQQ